MTTFKSADDVLTLLIHLGYLTYDDEHREIWIPNNEVQQEFINSIEDGGWEPVMQAIRQSELLLRSTLDRNEEKVAALIEQAHQDNTSVLKYHDENSLSCVVSLAYYSARKYYIIHRETPAGKGFADLIFEPRKNTDMAAFIVELKWGHSAEEALIQIKAKDYSDALNDYKGEILLVGVNYDKQTKKHSCRIERTEK